MYGLLVKNGVEFTRIAKAGARLLAALDVTARRLKIDLTITCACEGHPETDPHFVGEAYDVRTKNLTDDVKRRVLKQVMLELVDGDNPMDAPIAASGGLGTLHFWGWIEHPGADNEHLHVQRRHGTVYL